MAIKLENLAVKGIESTALLTVDSPSDHPAIGLKAEKAQSLQGDKWAEDPTKAKQLVTFIGEDGPVEMKGTVPQDMAVEISAAWRVVVEIEISTTALPAYEAGRKSRTLLAVSVRRVVEVWSNPKKCLWKAPGNLQPASGGKVMDENGRIS